MAKKAKSSVAQPTAKQLLKQLAAAPRVDVLGIGKGDVGAGISQGEKQWTLTFTLAPWRIVGQPVQRKALIVRRLVQERAIARYQKTIRKNVVVRIRARVVDPSVFGRADALLEQVIGPDRPSDKELNAALKEQQKPVRIKDPDLGTLTLDRQACCFEGKMPWNGRRLRLCLDAEEPTEAEKALRVARSLWSGQKQWHDKVQDYAVKKLLRDLNEVWLEGERPVTAEQFRKRLKLESVTVWPDGTFEFWHADDDLFGGHSVEITGNLKKGCTDADLVG